MEKDLQSVATYYLVLVLLTNCHIYIQENGINSQFFIRPLTLKDYLNA